MGLPGSNTMTRPQIAALLCIHIAVWTLVAMLSAIAARQTVVLFLDDWQWADESSGQVLTQLQAQASDARIMLLVASRERRIGAGVTAPVALIELEGLQAGEVRAVVKALLPGAPNLGLIDSILRQSGGVPLYIEELCQAGASLVFEHDAQAAAFQPEGVPHWLARLIESRFDGLSAAAQEIVSVASAIGNVVPGWLLTALSDVTPSADRMAELADAGLLYSDGPEQPSNFKHGITRDLIYSLLGLERRRALHLRAAQAIETRVGAEQLDEHYAALAYHYRCADSVEKAIVYALLAADKAHTRTALDSARLQLKIADSLHRASPQSQYRRVVTAYLIAEARFASLHDSVGQAQALLR